MVERYTTPPLTKISSRMAVTARRLLTELPAKEALVVVRSSIDVWQ
jgi:hypothetical protein